MMDPIFCFMIFIAPFIIYVIFKLFSILDKYISVTATSTLDKYIPVTAISTAGIDGMSGYEFESWCAKLLRDFGYENVQVTSGSGDQGVDIIAVKDGNRYAFQCKRYSSNVGNAAVQQVYAGMRMYQCQFGVVITNQYFTESAKTLANKTNIQLWDRGKLIELMQGRSNNDGGEKQKVNEPKKGIFQRIKDGIIRSSWKERKPPMTLEEIQRYKKLPHVDFEAGMNEEEQLYFAGERVDPWILGDDCILSLVSNEFENLRHAEHLAKVIEKHFYAETEVKSSERATYFVYVKVRARNIRVNFKKDRFIVANWA